LLPLGKVGIGLQHERDAVRIRQQVTLDQPLKVARVVAQVLPDRLQRPLERDGGEGIAAIGPRGECAHHQAETPREAPGVVFPQVKLGRVQGGFDGVGGDAIAPEGGKGVDDQPLDAVGIRGPRAAQARAEVGLPAVHVDACAGHVLSEPRIDERLVQRRSRRAHEDVGQNLERHGQHRIAAVRQQPTYRDQCLGVMLFVGADGIPPCQAQGLAERRLQRHTAVDRAEIVLLQVRRHAPKAFLRVVIAIEVDQRVRGVVVRRVKVEELLVGQGRDGLGITAGVQRVGRVREQRLAPVAVQEAVR